MQHQTKVRTKQALSIAAVLLASVTGTFSPNAASTRPASASSLFVETFTGAPSSPTPWNPVNWDVSVHSRDTSTWGALESMAAMHGADCAGPPATHHVSAYEDAVFQCRDHMMTAINAGGYGLVELTPNHLVDFSAGEAVIKLDVSTLRTSARDWWDVWISPYGDQLQLPLNFGSDVDLAGAPRNGIRVGVGAENQLEAQVYKDFQPVQFPEWPNENVTGNWWTGYETLLTPDAARRDTFEIRISRTHLKVGMPAYDFWWIDTDIGALSWDIGVVQFGHHSYNPTKDCNVANNPVPRVATCTPNTWHWDNISIAPSIPFTIIKPTPTVADSGGDTITLPAPAPAGSHLRFTGIGRNMKVSFNGGPLQSVTPQATAEPTPEEHFTSYWMPLPAGTTTVRFAGTDWFGGPWLSRNISIFSSSQVVVSAPKLPSGRLYDSRLLSSALRPGGSITEVRVAGQAAIPADSRGAALNVTVTEPTGPGFATVFPCGTHVPPTSSVNYDRGETRASAVVVPLSADGTVCIYTSDSTHLVVDAGASLGDALTATTPVRLHDSRSGGGGPRSGITEVFVAGTAGVPQGATAVALTVTSAESTASGFVTVYPCSLSVPPTSTLNFDAGGVASNAVIATVGNGGRVCFYSNVPTHLVVDATGYFIAGSGYSPIGPARLLETRSGQSGTVDGVSSGFGPPAAGSVTELSLVGRAGFPSAATIAVVNLTVTEPAASGFVTAYPCGTSVPGTSSINFVAGQTVSNSALVRIGASHKICLFNSASTHLVVDVNGWFSTASGAS